MAVDVARDRGTVRGLVHCAGRGSDRLRILDREGAPAPIEGFAEVVRVNLVGTYNVLRLVAAAIAEAPPVDGERGACVLTASVAAFEGQIGQASYTAAKAGVHAITLVTARDLASRQIRVNTIAPGVFDTPMLGRLRDDLRAGLAASVPNPKRLGTPDEYAALAVHMLSNGYLNGETIRLDGAIGWRRADDRPPARTRCSAGTARSRRDRHGQPAAPAQRDQPDHRGRTRRNIHRPRRRHERPGNRLHRRRRDLQRRHGPAGLPRARPPERPRPWVRRLRAGPAAGPGRRRRRRLGPRWWLRNGPRVRSRRGRQRRPIRAAGGHPRAGREGRWRVPVATPSAVRPRDGTHPHRRAHRRGPGRRVRPRQPAHPTGWGPGGRGPAGADGRRERSLAVTASVQVLRRSADWADDEAFTRQDEWFDPVFASADAAEGSRAFAERRVPLWAGR